LSRWPPLGLAGDLLAELGAAVDAEAPGAERGEESPGGGQAVVLAPLGSSA
jgi:hypothetical protein